MGSKGVEALEGKPRKSLGRLVAGSKEDEALVGRTRSFCFPDQD